MPELSHQLSHPCPFPDTTVTLIASHLPPDRYPIVLDPFAGIGKIHSLPQTTLAIELEPEWANQHPDTIVGDALHLPYDDNSLLAVATSPCFGNRMADHHDATDSSQRNTYKHRLGRDLSPGSSAILQWGAEYRKFHRAAWKEVSRVVKPGGRFVLNIKNHIRGGVEQPVSEWHLTTLVRMGWKLSHLVIVPAPGNRRGANYDLRTDHEYLYILDAVWTKVGR